MHLPKFEHFCPPSVLEAVELLKEYGPQSRLVAGGTDLYPRMKYGVTRPEVVVSLRGLSVKPPTVNQKGDLHLDVLMTLADVARSPFVRERAPLLAETATCVASNEIRHMGTLGGNLCQENRCYHFNQTHSFQFVDPCFKRQGDRCYLIPKGKKCWAVFCSDTAPALIALGATVEITGPEGARQLPLESLYTGDALKPLAISVNEVLTGVVVPGQGPLRGSAFIKFTLRGGMEFAALNVAVVLDKNEKEGPCQAARIVAGALSGGPIRFMKAEEALKGQSISQDLFRDVADLVAREAHPAPHHGFSAVYLKECLRVQTIRALSMASKRVGSGSH
ncbi:MAG: FAD binding domain-containing protein [Proteobacteria bacterium]|nr:FAD binding domain-containing protein [Pseudomonadota bacterium]